METIGIAVVCVLSVYAVVITVVAVWIYYCSKPERDVESSGIPSDHSHLISLQDELSHTKSENAALKDQIRELRNMIGSRISAEMSNDETKTEDINRKWRPSTIKERYSHLSFQTAGQLKAKMKELMGNSDKSSMAFLDRVFCTVYLITEEHIRDIFSEIARSVIDPTKQSASVNTCTGSKQMAIPAPVSDIMNNIKSYFRTQDDKHIPSDDQLENITTSTIATVRNEMEKDGEIVQDVAQTLEETMKSTESRYWKSYVEDVFQLTWYMAIQRPPMTFITPGIGLPADDHVCQELPTAGMVLEDPVVSYYLEPTLMHGDKVLEKGRVRSSGKPGSPEVVDATSIYPVLHENDQADLIKKE